MSDCQTCRQQVGTLKYYCCDFGGNPQTDVASGTNCFISKWHLGFKSIEYECPPCKNGATIWRNHQNTGPTIGRGKLTGSGGATNTVTDGQFGVAYFSLSVT